MCKSITINLKHRNKGNSFTIKNITLRNFNILSESAKRFVTWVTWVLPPIDKPIYYETSSIIELSIFWLVLLLVQLELSPARKIGNKKFNFLSDIYKVRICAWTPGRGYQCFIDLDFSFMTNFAYEFFLL